LVAAHVHADRAWEGRKPAQPLGHSGGPGVVESHPVHDRPLRNHPEQPGALVSGLGAWGHGADLHPAKPEPKPRQSKRLALVHSGGEPERRGEIDAPQRLPQARIRPGEPRSPSAGAQQDACQPVGGFGRKQEQQRADPAVHGARRVACALARSPPAAENRPFVQPATPLPGTQDLLFEAARRLRRCEATLCARFEAKGYAEVIPPAIEAADVFGPEAFRALDRSGRLIALRADFTAQVARIAATRLSGMSPLRLYYRGSIVRRVAPDSGPVHERLQAGCELVGAA